MTQKKIAFDAIRVLLEDKDVGLIDEILDEILTRAQNSPAHGGLSDGSISAELYDHLRKARNHLHSFIRITTYVLQDEILNEANRPATEGHGAQEQQVPFLNPGGDSLPGRRKLPM